jgi:mRNA-degrading endonuclease YafQ of YafQ-DinJ toxin-antitoxin module
VKRLLIRSPSFVRAAKRFVKKRPDNGAELRKALTLLENDVFHPSLKAHKLQGKLTGSWACCVGYDLRIIFRLDRYNEQEAIFSVLFRAFSGQNLFLIFPHATPDVKWEKPS